MAILRVAQMGHPVLRMIAEPVDEEAILTPEFQRFLEDLLETMYEYEGAGLAAPQVYTSIRVAVLTLDPETGPEFFINPVITALTEDTARTIEGCLSVHAIRAAVDRPNHVRVDALDRYGRPKTYELKGFPAVVVQHEFDHLDGILYVDRADPLTLAFLPEYERYGSLDAYVEGHEDDAPIDDEIIVLVKAEDEDEDELDDEPAPEDDDALPADTDHAVEE